jgi:cytoskeletal protein CcmA (bactofilin family)
MFSKPNSNSPQPNQPGPTPAPTPQPAAAAPTPSSHSEPPRAAPRPAAKGSSVIGAEMTLEGNVSSGGELHIDGRIKGDVRCEHVTVGDGGQIEGGIYADAVEVRGKVTGSITAKQVRLYGACHVDGDITHEQLAMETGAFFQGRSLRLQRQAAPAQPAAAAPKPPEPAPPPREASPPVNAKTTPQAPA